MLPAFAVTYALLCLLVSYIGRQTAVGFWGVLVLCVLFSPFIMAIILLVALPRKMT